MHTHGIGSITGITRVEWKLGLTREICEIGHGLLDSEILQVRSVQLSKWR